MSNLIKDHDCYIHGPGTFPQSDGCKCEKCVPSKDLQSVPDAMLTPHEKELAKAQRTSKTRLIGERHSLIVQIENVARWIDNGCDPEMAARELRLIADRLRVGSGDETSGRLTLDNERQVFFYEQEFYVLSNFSSFGLRWNGHWYPTSEHAYHVEKFMDNQRRFQIANAPSAHEAFKLAERHKGERRKDWDAVKVGIMRDILRAKADQNEYVRRKLLETGDRELIEQSWRDDFWGWGPNRDGQNMLGKLWMEIRAELRSPEEPSERPTPEQLGERWSDTLKALGNDEAPEKASGEQT